MTNDDSSRTSRLRPVLSRAEHAAGVQRGDLVERAGYLIQPGCRLSQIVSGRPPGITTHQWSVATRAQLDFVVCDGDGYHPVFAVDFVDPGGRTAHQQRDERMTDAVCAALGLELLRIESAVLAPAGPGRRIVEYVLDARRFQEAGRQPGQEPAAETPEAISVISYRDIIGRLPDGRTGYVNDLGAVARARAVDAFVGRQLVDPLLRGLHASWRDGSAEGWAWLAVRENLFLFERVRIWPHRLQCGIEPGRFVEDLAAAAIGERLKGLELGEPNLRERDALSRELHLLRSRRAEMAGEFAFEHVSFG
ncbi:DUF2726 domain-containing protein [Solwaraspora sp. WMMB335]|uniref:DUF2726 domain-containing protein n=1 Tax=Solwaraspora sp. WMMB335 TaxID=3404118 RepID=UPI003B94AE42